MGYGNLIVLAEYRDDAVIFEVIQANLFGIGLNEVFRFVLRVNHLDNRCIFSLQ